MSEVEKMYENAGCKLDCCKYAEYGYEGEEGTWYYCKKEGKECWTYPKGDADCVEKDYPPFTAEKQLKILCFIVNNKHSVTFHDQVFSGDRLTLEKIQENLAWAINRMWQSLTEEERKEIKEILE